MSQPQYFLGEAKRDYGCQAATYRRKAEGSDSLYPTCNWRVKYYRETAMRAAIIALERLLRVPLTFFVVRRKPRDSRVVQ